MNTATSAASRPSTIPALDSVRFFGVFAVMITHVGFHAGIYTNTGTFGHVASRMAVGVAVFFVLSGFLLSREWMVRADRGEATPAAGRYYWKRFWRIVPAYVVVVVICMLAFPHNRDLGAGRWLTTLGMADPFTTHGLPDGLTQTWSLSTEVAFYLVLPLVMLGLVGRTRRARLRMLVGLVLLAAITLTWLIVMDHVPGLDSRAVGEWLPAYLSWFAAGIALATVHSSPARYPRAHRALTTLAASPGVCWVMAAAALLVASTQLAGPWLILPLTTPEEITRHVLYLAVGVLLIIPAAFGTQESAWVRFLSRPLPRHLGHISYSIFLVHMSVIQLVMWAIGVPQFGGHFWVILLFTTAASIIAAELLYRLVERPFMRVGAARRATTTPSEATAAH